MSIVNGYATRAQLTAELDSSGSATIDTTRLDQIAYQASRVVDGWTGRRFYPSTDTRYFTPRYSDVLWIDDLLSVTTLKTDIDGGRGYGTTWTATDYDLEPYNAEDQGLPYTAIRVAPQSGQYFPRIRRGVEIVGKWGYYEVPEASGATVAGAHNDSVTALVVDSSTFFSVGHILVIGTEYLRVDAVTVTTVDEVDTHTLTVVRGINGSTAAAIDDGTAINVLTFPGITVSVLRLATRMWHLRKAPMGIATAGVQGMDGSTAGTRWIKDDHDLQSWLAPFTGGKML